MTKFKVGDKVRIINENGIIPNAYKFKNGEVVKVTVVAPSGIVLERKSDGNSIGVLATEFGAIELVSDKPTKNQRITALESEVAELKAKVEALEKAQKPSYKIGVDFASPPPNERRKAIIAEAKAFVAEVTPKMNSRRMNHEGNVTYRHKTTIPEFHVNTEKRVVTALVKGVHYGRLFEKAIAKCAPDDVFNADIGKAIALGRALGLDVSRFEQAVKPTEPTVGHVVEVYSPKRELLRTLTVKSVSKDDGKKSQYSINVFSRYHTKDGDRIIDDTEAQY